MSWFSKIFKKRKREVKDSEEETALSNLDGQGYPKNLYDEERMTPTEEEIFIDKIARKLIDIGMEFPAMVLFGSVEPFAWIGGELFYMITPFLRMLGLEDSGLKYKNFFEKSENLERLLNKIEDLSKSPKK